MWPLMVNSLYSLFLFSGLLTPESASPPHVIIHPFTAIYTHLNHSTMLPNLTPTFKQRAVPGFKPPIFWRTPNNICIQHCICILLKIGLCYPLPQMSRFSIFTAVGTFFNVSSLFHCWDLMSGLSTSTTSEVITFPLHMILFVYFLCLGPLWHSALGLCPLIQPVSQIHNTENGESATSARTWWRNFVQRLTLLYSGQVSWTLWTKVCTAQRCVSSLPSLSACCCSFSPGKFKSILLYDYRWM